MADIRPFAALRYNPQRVEWKRVLTQPYDKITPVMQDSYYKLDPHNLIAVEKGRVTPDDSPEKNVYTRAAAALREWKDSSVLVRDLQPAFYAYRQDFAVPGGKTRHVRTGFIGLGRLEDYASRVVHRHEQTLAGPKADRLELLRHTRVLTGQLFMLYSDASRSVDALLEEAMQAPAEVQLEDEFDVRHTLWVLSDARLIQKIRRAMSDLPLVIADGHHRYETSLAYRDECRAALPAPDAEAPHEFAMMTFVNAHSPGLTILPTHRVLAGVESFSFPVLRDALHSYFDWYAYPFRSEGERDEALAAFRKDLAARGRERHAIGAFGGGDCFYLFLLRRDADLAALLPDLTPGQRQLDVVLLHRLIFERALGITAEAVVKEKHLRYERDGVAALALVERGEAQAAFLLNAVRVEQVMQLALAGEVMPQKSTDFYPKLLSGITIYSLD